MFALTEDSYVPILAVQSYCFCPYNSISVTEQIRLADSREEEWKCFNTTMFEKFSQTFENLVHS